MEIRKFCSQSTFTLRIRAWEYLVIYLSSGGEFQLEVNGAVDKIGGKSVLALEEVCHELELPADVGRGRERRKRPGTSNVH